jgi:2-keto-3-deoxy-L-rhamnonate aldolase RhmA
VSDQENLKQRKDYKEYMNGAELKATLKAGDRVFGTMISVSRNPRWIPVFSGAGLDYVVIDTEHNPRSRASWGTF